MVLVSAGRTVQLRLKQGDAARLADATRVVHLHERRIDPEVEQLLVRRDVVVVEELEEHVAEENAAGELRALTHCADGHVHILVFLAEVCNVALHGLFVVVQENVVRGCTADAEERVATAIRLDARDCVQAYV